MHLTRVFSLDSRVIAVGAAAVLGGVLWLAMASAQAQSPAAVPAAAPVAAAAAPVAPASAAAIPAIPASKPLAGALAPASRPASARTANGKNANKQPTKPLWRDLKPAEQLALSPLASTWDTISVAQKRKWLALSKNYPKMSADEQAKLQSRMTGWAALSPQQRAQARLNFGEAQQLSPDDKKAKWEAYQALPPEEKRKLAARAAKPPVTAPAVKPVPAAKLATIPKPKLGEKTPTPPALSLVPVPPAPPAPSLAPVQPNPGTQLPVSAKAPLPVAVPASAPVPAPAR